MTLELKIGTDPEVFLRNKKTGKFVSAAGLIPGDKKNPFKVDKGAVQVDGLAAEFNIEPAKTAKEFSKNITTVVSILEEMVQKQDKDLELTFVPFARFDPSYFKNLPDDCKVLGCDPDFSSNNGSIIKKNIDITNRPFRTAAGHIHIGFSEGEDPSDAFHFEDCRFIAQHFHFNGGNLKIFKRYNTEEENLRLQYYGMFGAFRPKSYGVELREFSNIWVRKPEEHEKMFNYITKTMKKLAKE